MSGIRVDQAVQAALADHRAGHSAQAEAACRALLAAQPDNAEALHVLGLILAGTNRADEGIELIRQSIAYRPGAREGHQNLGILLMKRRRWKDAAQAYRQFLAIFPADPMAHASLCGVLSELDQPDAALAAGRKALELDPRCVEAMDHLGITCSRTNRYEEAIGWFRKAIAIRPDFATSHHNLSHVLLRLGRFEAGWEEYEYRWSVGDPPPAKPSFRIPEWDGKPLEGRRILLWPEQGYGDIFQFVRYATLVARMGGEVVVAAPTEMAELMRTVEGVAEVISRGMIEKPADCHYPIMSLPRIFRTRLETIPAQVPYQRASPDRVRHWRERLSGEGKRIGLVWAGRPTHLSDHRRSMPLAKLAPLLSLPGTRFFSLQKGDASAQLGSLPGELKITDLAGDLRDFSETAGLIEALDHVIAVDTAVAHLAGALGKPVSLLLATHPDWRWMLDRADTPWYPTIRLFRQQMAGDWDSVINKIRDRGF